MVSQQEILQTDQTEISQVTGGCCIFWFSPSKSYAAVAFTTTPHHLHEQVFPSLIMHKRCHLKSCQSRRTSALQHSRWAALHE